MVSAKGVLRHEGFRYALDNGAWNAHVRGEAFDEGAFLRAIDRLGGDADWIVLPDIVAGGLRSLAFSMEWSARLGSLPKMLAVQDGMTASDVRHHLGGMVGIFVGGSTGWKEATMAEWGNAGARGGKDASRRKSQHREAAEPLRGSWRHKLRRVQRVEVR